MQASIEDAPGCETEKFGITIKEEYCNNLISTKLSKK